MPSPREGAEPSLVSREGLSPLSSLCYRLRLGFLVLLFGPTALSALDPGHPRLLFWRLVWRLSVSPFSAFRFVKFWWASAPSLFSILPIL